MAGRISSDNTGTGKSGDWRLSRIDEELEKVHFSTNNAVSVILPGTKAGTLPRRSTQTAWDNDIYGLADHESFNTGQLCNNSSSTPNLDKSDNIYSKAVVRPAYSGDKIIDSKQAVKIITGKYDSLGRVKPSMAPPGGQMAYTASVDHSPDSQFGSADFPPPPPEFLLQLTETEKPSPPPPCSPSLRYPPPQSPPLTATPSQQGSAPRVAPMTLPKSAPAHIEDIPEHRHKDDCPGFVPAISEQELLQVDMFYRSHKTDVFVCQSLANLYFGNIRSSGSPMKAPCRIESGHWQFFKSGIPVLVLDSGKSRRKRKLSIILAERGTGFALWKDAMNHLTNYSSPQGTFHTMHLSNDHTRMAGLRFVDGAAAIDFYHKIYKLVSDPNDDILNLSGNKSKKKAKEKDKKRYKAPTKADISTPCCFTHVTKLDRAEGAMNVPSQRSMPSSPIPRPTASQSMTASFS